MLIYLTDLYHDYQRPTSVVPTNIGYIAAYSLERFGDDIEVRLFKNPEALLAAAEKDQPDILGLSNYMWNERLNDLVGRRIKQAKSDTVIVMGGPNIRTTKDDVGAFLKRYDYIDFYILYAAEIPFADIVAAAFERGPEGLKDEEIPGCFHLSNGEIRGEQFIAAEKNLDYIPSPFLTGLLDPFLEAGHSPLFETNRGCPFSCTFCVWGIAALGKIKTFSMERVTAEMLYVAEKFPKSSSSWILADANFGIMPRDVELATLLRRIYDETHAFDNVNIWWSKTITNNIVEIARILGKLCQAYVAFQSLDPVVLKLIKRSNISVEKLAEFKAKIEGYTNGSFTDILLGLPGETMESHMNSYYSALRLGFDQVGGGEVRLLPGSEMDEASSREKFGLATKFRISEADVGLYGGGLVYELEEVIRSTNWISEEEMLKLRVVRALLYGSLTLGDLSPLNAVLLHHDVNIFVLLSEIVDRRARGTEFSNILDELDALSHAEWFATTDHAKEYFADGENRRAVFDNPPVKLNFWLLAKLILSPAAHREFHGELRSALLAKNTGIADHVIDDLLTLCARRSYLGAALSGAEAVAVAIPLGPDTLDALVASGYLDHKDRPANGALRYEITPETAALIRDRIGAGRHETMLGMSLILQEFGNGIYMTKSTAPATDSALAEDESDGTAALAGETAVMHAWG